MDRGDRNPGRLRSVGGYLPEALRFYELKNEYLTPVIFVTILFANFLANSAAGQENTAGAGSMLVYIAGIVLMPLLFSAYLYACIRDKKGEPCTIGECVAMAVRNSGNLILAFLAYMMFIVLGGILLIVPGIIIAIVFVFNTCFIVDRDAGIGFAFRASRQITTGRRVEIFSIFLVFYVAILLPSVLIIFIALRIYNDLVSSFLVSFISTLAGLMQQKLIAMMYIDILYGAPDA